ncbi:MAG: hypothetical protein ABIF89_02440 [bacterium]
MKIEEIKKLVIEKFPKYVDVEYDYRDNKALSNGIGSMWERIDNFDSGLKENFEKFLKNGELPEAEIKGWSIKRLIEERGMDPVGAFIMYDWLMRDSRQAVEALAEGYDIISEWKKK